MSEKVDFRSKRPFTLFYYPSSQLPPRAMSEEEAYTLWCLIDGERRPFPIKAGRNWEIAYLPESILGIRSDLCASINDIFLWKVTKPTSVDPGKTFCDRFPCPILDFSDSSIVTELDDRTKSVSDVFPAATKGQLHIVVQVKMPAPERLAKKQRLDGEDEKPSDMQVLWNQTWNRTEEAIPWFALWKTERDTEQERTSAVDVPEYCWVLSPPDDIAGTLNLKPSTVLFRDDYLRALSALFASSGLGHFAHNLDCKPGANFPNIFSGVQVPQQILMNAFILSGNSGIGKSIWLRILLVLRLSARLPTFYSSGDSSIFLFTNRGAAEIPSKSMNLRFFLRDEPDAWALFDSTESLTGPPQVFLDEGIFVVQTPSPRSNRLEWRKKVPPTELCCLALWSPAELICAAPFQKIRHSEKALVKFCELYGSSARDAYGNASNIDTFEANLKVACHSLKYDKLADIIADVQNLDFRHEISHTILCISPAEVVLKYTFDFTSRHVYDHILQVLRTSQVRVASNFYRLFLLMGKTRSVAGHMLEPAAREILADGGTFEVILLKSSLARTLFHWKTPEVLSENVMTRLHITSSDISLNNDSIVGGGQPPSLELPKGGPLKNFAFYFPSSQNQATYDFLLYDPMDQHAWIFQVTTSPSHSVKAKGVNDLISRGVQKISYIAITSPEETIDLPFPEDLNSLVVDKYQLRLR